MIKIPDKILLKLSAIYFLIFLFLVSIFSSSCSLKTNNIPQNIHTIEYIQDNDSKICDFIKEKSYLCNCDYLINRINNTEIEVLKKCVKDPIAINPNDEKCYYLLDDDTFQLLLVYQKELINCIESCDKYKEELIKKCE